MVLGLIEIQNVKSRRGCKEGFLIIDKTRFWNLSADAGDLHEFGGNGIFPRQAMILIEKFCS